MIIQTNRADVFDVKMDDIPGIVMSLTEQGESFVILSDHAHGAHCTLDCAERPQRYLQAAGTCGEGFLVEYRDGGSGDHFRADDERIAPRELAALLTAYLQADGRGAHDQDGGGWRDLVRWHRVDMSPDHEPVRA